MTTVATIILMIAALISLVGYVWMLVLALNESSLHGFLFFFIPFYMFWYALTRFGRCWQGFSLYFAGGSAASFAAKALYALAAT